MVSKNKRRKKNKKLQFFVEFLVCSIIIFSVFNLRSLYGKILLNENSNIENADKNSNNSNNAEEKKEEVKKVVLTNEQKTKQLDEIVSSYKKDNNKIGIVYNNISSNYRYSFDENVYFSAASTPKVIYALYVYDRIAMGQIASDMLIPYNNSLYTEGGGEITNQPKKDKYPLEDVVMNMLTYSDNTATNMILGNNSNAEHVVEYYLKKLELSYKEDMVSQNKLTPEIMEKVWLYLYNNQEKYPKIIEYLKKSEQNEWIKDGIKGKTIASKYGAVNNSAHDTAIVYGDKGDYILIIYTEGVANSANAIADIANKINKLHDDNS